MPAPVTAGGAGTDARAAAPQAAALAFSSFGASADRTAALGFDAREIAAAPDSRATEVPADLRTLSEP